MGAGTVLDYETRTTYMVTVMAEDSFGDSSSIDVTIKVTGVDETPDITGEAEVEHRENRTNALGTYRAVDPEGTATTSWSLGGADAAVFDITGGLLTFKESPDFEMAADVVGTSPSTAIANDNKYEITVQAMESTGKTGMEEVTVEVTNVDEPGKLTLSALRPQSATVLTATHSDPDGGRSDLKWQWAKATAKNGSYSDIDKAISSTYEPDDDDTGHYLRATASYADAEGPGKSVMVKSAYVVQGVQGDNNAPKFADDQDPDTTGDQADVAREVAENTAAGSAIGDPVIAEDEDSDVLTYTLSGTDASSFDIDWATGQLMTKAALDEETKGSYTVIVRATDPAGIPQAGTAVAANSDEITVNITVTDVNEPPAVTGDAAVTFAEDTGDITTALDTYDEDNPEDNVASTWSVAGPDGSKFTAAGGALKFKAKPDYEAPTDANKDNVYEVTVRAADAEGNIGMKAVKVTVTNEDEDGTVTLSKTQPRVGVAVNASLTDPDGRVSGLTWQWYDGAISENNLATNAGVWLKNRRAAVVLMFLAALWSVARVYNGLHYPSDVLAGGLIGAAVAWLTTLGLRAIEPLPTWVLRGARSLHLA